ncbi:MAG: permease prefix domain 1-containing protein, partial [Candidatus Acidiferrales bacterium]
MKLWHRILAAVGLHRAGCERGLDAELQFHVESRIEELRGESVSEAEARRRALVELGGVQQVKEEVRAMRGGIWLETLWQDVRYAARSLRRNPGFAAVAVLTLALGIGANSAVFSLLDTVLLKQLPVRDPEQLVLLDWIA